MSKRTELGQSMLELIVVIAVGIVIVTALVFSSISALRNSQLSKNQAQATRLSQEGLETLRVLRERDGIVNKGGVSCLSTPCKLNSDFSNIFSCPTASICYFNIDGSGNLTAATGSVFESFPSADLRNFKRQIQVEDVLGSGGTTVQTEKKFTSIVKWTDFAGEHISQQTTLLRKL